jgi:hypothetical protein
MRTADKYLINEVDANKKKAFDQYKKLQKDIKGLLGSYKIALQNHQNKFFQGEFPGWGPVGDLEKVKNDLEETLRFCQSAMK